MMIEIRGLSANYFKTPKKSENDNNYDDPNFLKNRPDGNAKKFAAIINSARDLLPNLNQQVRPFQEDAIEEGEAENSDESESNSKNSSKSLEHNSNDSDFNSSFSSVTSLTKFDNNLSDRARRTSEQYTSLSDYWKEQAERRRSRIGLNPTEDPQRWNRIKPQSHPKEVSSLTPRQRQLLGQASGSDKNLHDSKYGGIPIRCIFLFK